MRCVALVIGEHGVTLQRHHPTGDALCQYVREQAGETVILSFSAGKDAVASWLQLRRYFRRIVPFYLAPVPELAFLEEGVRYYERFFKTPILRYTHPSFWRMIRNFVYQPPERCALIEDMYLPHYTYEDVEAHVRERADAPDAFVAMGTRATDSLVRRTNIRRFGSLNPRRRSFLPIFDWKVSDLKITFEREGVKLPVDYRLYGRSFDGLQHLFTGPVKEHFPRDYERLLHWFPLLELEFMRRDLKGASHA